MHEQFAELKRYYENKGLRINIEKNANGKESFCLAYTNKDPKIIPVEVAFLYMGSHVRIGADVSEVHPSRVSKAISYTNTIQAQTSFVKFVVWDSGIINARADIPTSIPLANVGNVADELVELVKIAVRRYSPDFEKMKTESVSIPKSSPVNNQPAPSPQKPIHMSTKQAPDDDWLFDVTKF